MDPTNQSEASLPLPPPLVNPFLQVHSNALAGEPHSLILLAIRSWSISTLWPSNVSALWPRALSLGQDLEMAQQTPSSGPNRTRANRQRKGFCKAGTLRVDQTSHESSGTVRDNRSNDNTGDGVAKIWRTPSKYLLGHCQDALTAT